MSNEMFPRLMPIDIKFFSGESPSPQKLTGIFKYLYSAFYVLESFLGNGVDYRPESDQDRKMLFNISNAIGSMGKLYKPSNALVSLQAICRSYASVNSYKGVLFPDRTASDILHDQHAGILEITDDYVHAFADKEEYMLVSKPLNIPIDTFLKGVWAFGIECRGSGRINIYLDNTDLLQVNIHEDASDPDVVVSGSILTKHYGKFINNSYVSHIEILPGSIGLEVLSIYLVDRDECYIESEGDKPYNIGYALGIDNPTYFEVGKPCLNANVCEKRTCSYCIGNTYDFYTRVPGVTPVGKPVCAGKYRTTVDPALIPEDGLEYDPDNGSSIYAIQSPLLMNSKPYLVKLAPYAVHANLASGSTIPKNQVVVYDLKAGGGSSSPIKYNMPVQSGGRPDIVFVNDTDTELSPSSSRILIIGGTYGITNLLQDMLKAITETEQRTISVYAD